MVACRQLDEQQVVIEYSLCNGDLLFSVQVVPRASRSEIVGEHNGSLRIRLAAPPVDGAARRGSGAVARLSRRAHAMLRPALQLR